MSLLEFVKAVFPVANAYFVTDSSYVTKNYAKLQMGQNPESHLDVWHELRDLLVEFPARGLVLLKVESHRDHTEVGRQGADPLHFLVNEVADAVASSWADKIRVAERDRDSRSFAQAIAYQVRHHLAHSLLASIEASGEIAPRQKVLLKQEREYKTQLLLTEHTPTRGVGSRIACSKCGGSAPRSLADKFLETSCHRGLFNGVVLVPSAPVINGHCLDTSHTLGFSEKWGSTVCFKCGCVANQAVRHLSKPCTGVISHYGKQRLRELARGEMPGTSKLSKASTKSVASKKVLK